MKLKIKSLIYDAIDSLVKKNIFPEESISITVEIDTTKNLNHGDFTTNIAMKLAKVVKDNPHSIAEKIISKISDPLLNKIEIAGPGFINFTLKHSRYEDLLTKILSEKNTFGCVQNSSPQKILIEFISANPTGPLHVGHGRGAAYGATLANILQAAGNKVDTEYYVNDAGRQIDILGVSVYLRYLQNFNIDFEYPVNAYQADYVKQIAKIITDKYNDKFISLDNFFDNLPIEDYQEFIHQNKELQIKLNNCKSSLVNKKDFEIIKNNISNNNKRLEIHIDEIILRSKQYLNSNFMIFSNAALDFIRSDIKDDLEEFGVLFDNWFSEKSLYSDGKIDAVIDILKANNHTYEKQGALWFKATKFGDEKDRVLKRENGIFTYFASDIAYHNDKFVRNYDKAIDIFGADHHGYIARIKAALKALGHNEDKLQINLVQFAVLYKHAKKMQMSTRSGKYVTLRDLRNIVGNSAARFFYIMRKPSQHMDFDLDLAVKNTKDNPLYYIQYAYARICRVFDKLDTTNIIFDLNKAKLNIDNLNLKFEINLLRNLEKYPDIIKSAAKDCAPHYLINYLKDISSNLHGYYDSGEVKFLAEDNMQQSRLLLLKAVHQVIENGLGLAGIKAPRAM